MVTGSHLKCIISQEVEIIMNAVEMDDKVCKKNQAGEIRDS